MDVAAVAIRPAHDADAAAIITLIGDAWSDYPGMSLDVDRDVPELRALASHYAAKGGTLWAADAEGQLAGIVAALPSSAAATWEVGKLYVARPLQGCGLADRLLALAEGQARRAGAQRIEVWSDTRLDRAHAFYEKHGYLRGRSMRPLNDSTNGLDFHFDKPLTGLAVETLGTAASASAERALAEVLRAAVDAGDSICFRPPLTVDAARSYWRRVASQVANGCRILLVAWLEGAIVGAVVLAISKLPAQRHRADLRQLLVLPQARRRGVGRALVRGAEAAAIETGRSLIVHHAASATASLFREIGYTEAGRVPGYASCDNGRSCDMVIFWRTLT
jgi:GNAT superfamily N-acetyltransferase